MALTPDEITYIRAWLPYVSGSTDPMFVSDAMLDILYAGLAGSDIDKTIAYAMRQMCAKASNKVSRTNSATGDSVSGQQEREHICALADTWAVQTGIPGGGVGVVTTGTISLGIDEEDDWINNL